jgi:hypothetical protein
MTRIVIADKNRLTVRGVLDGARYLVRAELNGWWIEPAPESRRRQREVKEARQDLSAHLDSLARHGFSFEPSKKEGVPPCRF